MSAHSYSLTVTFDRPISHEMRQRIEENLGNDRKCFLIDDTDIQLGSGDFYDDEIEAYMDSFAKLAKEFNVTCNGESYDLDIPESSYYCIINNECRWMSCQEFHIHEADDSLLITELENRGYQVSRSDI